MNEKQVGLVVIVPLIVATGVALWRQRALGTLGLAAATAATLAVAGFLFLTL